MVVLVKVSQGGVSPTITGVRRCGPVMYGMDRYKQGMVSNGMTRLVLVRGCLSHKLVMFGAVSSGDVG